MDFVVQCYDDARILTGFNHLLMETVTINVDNLLKRIEIEAERCRSLIFLTRNQLMSTLQNCFIPDTNVVFQGIICQLKQMNFAVWPYTYKQRNSNNEDVVDGEDVSRRISRIEVW